MKKLLFLLLSFMAVSLFSYGQITYSGVITDKNDDVEESTSDGGMYFDSSDLELVEDGDAQVVGLRFTDVMVPKGAKVTNAYIQFTVDETSSSATNLVFKAEDVDNSLAFADETNNVSNRVQTANSVAWENVPAWENVGDANDAQKTPNLSSIVQPVFDREGWSKGNALTIIITGSGSRIAESADGDTDAAPKLVIEYYLKYEKSMQIAYSLDDAEENGPLSNYGPGSLYYTSSDLELVTDGASVQTVGLRFINVEVPQNAIIESATIQFTADKDEVENDSTSLWIKLEDIAMSPSFVEDALYQMASRTVFEDSVLWEDIPAWSVQYEAGENQKTPELKTMVQKIVEKADWLKGNAMSFIINGIGERSATSFDGDPEKAPILNITYLTDKVAPLLVSEIPDKHFDAGWGLNFYVGNYFADEDSELTFTAELAGGLELPEWLNFENGTFYGFYNKAITLPIVVTANGDGETVSDMFMLVCKPKNTSFLTQLGTIMLGTFDNGAAEISAYEKVSKKLFVTNAENSTIDIIDMTDPTNLSKTGSIDISIYGGGVNSVAAKNEIIVAAIEATPKQAPGKVVAFDANGTKLWDVTVGALPDMVTFNEDGTKVIVANEGEPNEDYTVDPEGSVSIIDVETQTVTTASFTAYNGQEDNLSEKGVRIFGQNATVAQDMEPEYITVKGNLAFVTCQENNAIAVVNIETSTIDDVYGLGYKDHSLSNNGIDASNKSNFINIRPWPVMGMYQPDAIASYEVNGKTYLVTANEGDAREYGDFEEEIKLKDINLDANVFPNIDELKENENLGRLKFSNFPADTNANGEYKKLYAFGARSFSIWDSETGDLVYDSKDEFEQITAAMIPMNFNCSDGNTSAQNRSKNKGPEPEAVTVGKIGDKTYAFVGLERVGGIMVYDITSPSMPKFVEYTNNRDFSTDPETDHAEHGDNGPEGIIFIDGADSPNGENLVIVSNEISGTVTAYSAGNTPTPFTLAIMHNNDGESDLLGDSVMVNGNLVKAGSIAQFKTVLDTARTRAKNLGYASVMLSSGDNFLAGKEFNASQALGKYFDVVSLDSLDYDAICLGNHDFDFGPNVLTDFINEFETNKAPYLSSNLSYENEPRLDSLFNEGRIKPYTIVEKLGEKIGIIGLTTPTIDVISSPGNVTISNNIVDSVQTYVDSLISKNVNKIILISHLQSIMQDTALAAQIKGVDIMIAGGGDELLTNDPSLGEPYNHEPWGAYPVEVEDIEGNPVYIVTTPGNYRYLGNLVVDFDNNGVVTKIHQGSDPILVANVEENSDLKTNVIDPINDYIADLTTNILAISEVDIDLRKSEIRTRETNGGNLVADALLWQANKTYNEFGVANPQVAIQNGGGLRLDNIIPAGNFAEVLTYDICAFTNILSVIESVSAQDFLAVMEHALGDVENVGGRFSQIAGFKVVYDPVATAGERVISIELDDATKIVENGEVVSGAPSINIATIDYLAGGGDGYPYEDLGYTFKTIGATYQQALANYLVSGDGLNGLITAGQYPLGGEGRIIEQANIPTVDLTFYEEFTTTDAWIIHSETGEQEWTNIAEGGVNNSSMMEMNGYSGGAVDNVDWLISPALNVSGIPNVSVEFQTYVKYSGPELETLYSTDFAGYGEPSNATWTNIPDVQLATEDAWTPSGEGVINNTGDKMFIAFKYTSSVANCSAKWRVDSLVVTAYNSISDNLLQDVSWYPNPFNEELKITNTKGISEIVISNILGKPVMRKAINGNTSVHTSDLVSGVYIITFIADNGLTRSARIIKQ